MKIIHIFKDGTETNELKDVYVPKEIVERVAEIAKSKSIDTEGGRPDSRKPHVEDGTIEDDQRRRDFTINAMAWSLNGETFGELVDPFDGMYDLEDCIICTPCDPDITFSDDPLRMMRGIRFASQLGFELADETFEAMKRNRERIKIVSQERIITELNKIVASPVPSIGLELLELTGLLGQFSRKGRRSNQYQS